MVTQETGADSVVITYMIEHPNNSDIILISCAHLHTCCLFVNRIPKHSTSRFRPSNCLRNKRASDRGFHGRMWVRLVEFLRSWSEPCLMASVPMPLASGIEVEIVRHSHKFVEDRVVEFVDKLLGRSGRSTPCAWRKKTRHCSVQGERFLSCAVDETHFRFDHGD